MKADIFTSNVEFIEISRKHFSIRRIYCEKSKLTPDFFDYCKWNDLLIIPVENSTAISIAQGDDISVDLGLSFGFGIIFSTKQLNQYQSGIWNVHTGDLPKFRGRHPITHAFLQDEKEIIVTIHQLDQFIDQGYLIAKGEIRREYRDTELDVLQKVLELLENDLLFKAITNFNVGRLEKIQFGTYKPNFSSGIQIASTELVTCNFLYNAIQSQFIHGGVMINGVNYIMCHYYYESITFESPWELVQCLDGKMIIYPKS